MFCLLELLQQQVLDSRAEGLEQRVESLTPKRRVHCDCKFGCTGSCTRANHILKTSLDERCNIVLGPHLHFIILIIHTSPREVLHEALDSVHNAAELLRTGV